MFTEVEAEIERPGAKPGLLLFCSFGEGQSTPLVN